MKKRVIVLIFTGILAVSAAACGVKKADVPVEEPASEETASDTPVEAAEEAVEEASEEAASFEDYAPTIDITGCDTFTQIVDQKLADGMGYANETIDGTDVLLVSSGTFDNLDGKMAAIDAAVFIYKDGVPLEIGSVCSGGTAYPLAIKDGKLYSGGNHFVCRYSLKDNRLLLSDSVTVTYDTDGNETCYYSSEDSGADNDISSDEAQKIYQDLCDEMNSAEVIGFSTVGGDVKGEGDLSESSAGLPKYEYPGPEAFYTTLYDYISDEFGSHYEPSDVGIPCPIIIAEDESNKDDILVWGNFQIYNYRLNGDTLETESGGSYPGLLHFKDSQDGYEVTKAELVEDGSGYDPSAKKIFGKHYDDFISAMADEEKNESIRAQIIANYVAANDLKITAFKDYGWDPVKLPEENIDSFYSKLD